MRTGLYISGTGHGILIGWLLVGGLFVAKESPPLSVAEVSLIDSEAFAALSAPARAPQIATEAPNPQTAEPDRAPDVPDLTSAPLPTPRPERVPETPAEAEPEALEPIPETVVEDQAPVLSDAPDTAPTTVLPESAPAPAPRVAPTPAPPPPPDVSIDNAPTIATAPSPEPAPDAQPEEQTTAPEEATTEIVTEAEETDSVLTSSPRPRPRPNRPAPAAPTEVAQPAETSPAEPAQTTTDDAVRNALAEALADAPGTGTAPTGPPLTRGEREGLRLAVQSCWNVNPTSESARVTVTVGFSLSEDGKVIGNRVTMVSNSDGTAQAVESAFEAARRAVLRCQSNGYDLPAEKYAQWRDVEVTFDPSKLRN